MRRAVTYMEAKGGEIGPRDRELNLERKVPPTKVPPQVRPGGPPPGPQRRKWGHFSRGPDYELLNNS